MVKRLGTVLIAVMVILGGGDVFAARSGGTFNFCAPYGGDLFSLDLHLSNRAQDALVGMNIHRSLYIWDSEKGKPVLELADAADVSEDGLVYTYHLRKNVKFHNGRTMTADDIIWSYERLANPKTASPNARFVRMIKGARDVEEGKTDKIAGLRKIDDFTLELTLEAPTDPAYPLHQAYTAILPREEVEKLGPEFASRPVGCGPFKFDKWVRGSEVVMTRFADFYKPGQPYLDKVVYKIMGEGASRDIAFKARDLDATVVGAAQYPEYKNTPELSGNLIEVAEMYTRLICFNLDFKPFSDKRVRQAFNHAINSELIIRKLLKGKAFPAVGFLPQTSPAFNPDLKGYEYNPEKARALMKEAGYEKGFTFECLATSNKSWGTSIVEAMMPFLKAINVTVRIQQMEGATMSAKGHKGDFHALIYSLESGPDPLEVLRRFDSRTPRTGGNFPGYNSPEFDRLLDAAAAERDTAKKMDLLRKADAVFTEDAPVWFFNYNKAVIAYHPWVHGIKKNAEEMMYQDMGDVWIDETSPRAGSK
ncbi:ABC transporter substrate-binding protein [Desulfonema ishimotonii]|uniref:ABC transporter substrate-binding protein n=1 Tax=Desulfonema ishimotonii TaxID=45657 RepID=A0A401FXB0_9BACT|nr:ABC transporter substrate-binding protein [Desulfonema ishimotonii]GBC61628.1 ABC transporter substrate-binding protein [Desulfonema ishimotonii]